MRDELTLLIEKRTSIANKKGHRTKGIVVVICGTVKKQPDPGRRMCVWEFATIRLDRKDGACS